MLKMRPVLFVAAVALFGLTACGGTTPSGAIAISNSTAVSTAAHDDAAPPMDDNNIALPMDWLKASDKWVHFECAANAGVNDVAKLTPCPTGIMVITINGSITNTIQVADGVQVASSYTQGHTSLDVTPGDNIKLFGIWASSNKQPECSLVDRNALDDHLTADQRWTVVVAVTDPSIDRHSATWKAPAFPCGWDRVRAARQLPYKSSS